jgi:hypothetical protein
MCVFFQIISFLFALSAGAVPGAWLGKKRLLVNVNEIETTGLQLLILTLIEKGA